MHMKERNTSIAPDNHIFAQPVFRADTIVCHVFIFSDIVPDSLFPRRDNQYCIQKNQPAAVKHQVSADALPFHI